MEDADHRLIVEVKNAHGLHFRPCFYVVRRCAGYEATVEISKHPDGGQTVWWNTEVASGEFVWNLLSLGIRDGDEILVETRGRESGAVMEEIRFVLTSPAPPNPSRENVRALRRGGHDPDSPKGERLLKHMEGRDFRREKEGYELLMNSGCRSERMWWTKDDEERLYQRNLRERGY